jgi:Helicase associated domain
VSTGIVAESTGSLRVFANSPIRHTARTLLQASEREPTAMVSWEDRFAIFVRSKKKGDDAQPDQKKWERDQRYLVKVGRLSDDKWKRLKDAGFDFEPQAIYANADDELWMQKFDLLKAYKIKEGNFSVRLSHPDLGVWVRTQQRLKEKEGLTQRMQNRRALLSEIGFWKDLGSAECDESDAGTECTDIAHDSNSRRNDAAGVVPAINGTGVDTVVALWPGGKQNGLRQKLKRAGNSDRRSSQPRLASSSKVEASVLEARAPPNPGKAVSCEMETKKNKSAPTAEESLLEAPLQTDIRAWNAGAPFASSSSHVAGSTARTGTGKDTTVTPLSQDPPGVAHGTGLDTIEQNDQRLNENLKRAGTKLADRHGKQQRLRSAPRVEALAAFSRLQAPLQSSAGESLDDGILLDSILQSSKIFKDARCKVLKECQELVMEKNRLNTQAIALYEETKRANPSTKSNAPEDRSDHGSKVSAFVASASTDEHHENCVIKAKKLFDAIFDEWKDASQLQEQLVHIIEQKQSELASRNKAFEAWQTKSDELSRKRAKLQNLLASVEEEESNHNQAL